jgi:hypothetical protein
MMNYALYFNSLEPSERNFTSCHTLLAWLTAFSNSIPDWNHCLGPLNSKLGQLQYTNMDYPST